VLRDRAGPDMVISCIRERRHKRKKNGHTNDMERMDEKKDERICSMQGEIKDAYKTLIGNFQRN
jgi:hypothetical protein